MFYNLRIERVSQMKILNPETTKDFVIHIRKKAMYFEKRWKNYLYLRIMTLSLPNLILLGLIIKYTTLIRYKINLQKSTTNFCKKF